MDKQQKARVSAMEADREGAGLSFRALGAAAGVSDSRIREAVKGVGNMTDENWGKVAAALPGGKLEALLQKAGLEIPAPAAPRTAPVPAEAGMRRDAPPSGLTLLAWNELEPGDNYRKSFPQEELQQLAESIAEKGLLQNIVARPVNAEEGARPSVLRPARLVAGERRWRAIGLLIAQGRWDPCARNIPVRLQSLDDMQARALALIENLQRQDVPVLEEAAGFKALTALGWDTEKIAAACHIAQRTVQDRLQLFDRLKPVARKALEDGQITIDQARAIVSTPIEAEQNELVTKAVRNGYSAASLRDAAKTGKVPARKAAFDLKQYKGEFIGSGAERVFADTAAFLKLQRKAALKKAEEIEASGRFACVELLEDGQDFDHSRFRYLDEEDVAAETDEAAQELHVFVSVNRWHHDIEIDYGRPHKKSEEDGLVDDEDGDDAGEAQLELEREIARKRRKRREDEVAASVKWCRDMLAAAGERPADYFRREILLALTGVVPAWWPNHLTDGALIENLPATIEILQKATGRGFLLDDMEEDVSLAEIPRNEPLGYMLDEDATFLAKWLDEQPDMEVVRLHVRLEASRSIHLFGRQCDRETIALSERLGVTVPDHMRPLPGDYEDEPGDAFGDEDEDGTEAA
ncbi:ParB/RepB/Spo0J family partition protein [Hoeflea sp.]|uniref:ParB/RepB/Spo0J family partition protein n=1 Tax=Hoeflea sp. TaxID=1940281 RepID=UPI00199AEBF5|nr:ParB/RepB/Spo0J family partition protein [Hoeflea sp.]MBC7282639.1 ParB/RepB/Spo0J family partition protein [Hoeflea sp.]